VTKSPPTPDGLPALVTARRLALGMTKAELARRAGVSRGTIHEVETGERTNMQAGSLLKLERALGIELRPHLNDPPPTTGRRLVVTIEVWVHDE
jgi:transcriptional regulator with XRE-family HTH domain